jgi:hypothetical protein
MNLDDLKKLMEMQPKELMKLDKSTVHEGYKLMLSYMLTKFFFDIAEATGGIHCNEDLQNFVSNWINKNIKPPHPDWNPGDCAS